MARLIKPSVDRIFATKVVQLTQDLSLRSTCIVCTTTNNPCPNCYFDARLDTSTGKYREDGPTPFTGRVCPVCNGKGKIVATSQLQIPANVRWGAKPAAPDVPEPEGHVPVGFARIKAEVKYYSLLLNCTYLLIDGIRCIRYDAPRKRGLQSYVITEMLAHIDK